MAKIVKLNTKTQEVNMENNTKIGQEDQFVKPDLFIKQFTEIAKKFCVKFNEKWRGEIAKENDDRSMLIKKYATCHIDVGEYVKTQNNEEVFLQFLSANIINPITIIRNDYILFRDRTCDPYGTSCIFYFDFIKGIKTDTNIISNENMYSERYLFVFNYKNRDYRIEFVIHDPSKF